MSIKRSVIFQTPESGYSKRIERGIGLQFVDFSKKVCKASATGEVNMIPSFETYLKYTEI